MKYGSIYKINIIRVVALFARAWIEIYNVHSTQKTKLVALFARAWIEIRFDNGY